MRAETAIDRSAVGSAGLKKPGSMPRPLMVIARSGIGSNGASVNLASPVAAPDWPVAASSVAARSPLARRFSWAGFWPAFGCNWVRLALASSLNGLAAPMLPLALASPTGVIALASRSCHCWRSPCSLKRTSASSVPASWRRADHGHLGQLRVVDRQLERRRQAGRHLGRPGIAQRLRGQAGDMQLADRDALRQVLERRPVDVDVVGGDQLVGTVEHQVRRGASSRTASR